MSSLPCTRCIAHLDVNAFFASLEQRDNPGLRGCPVAVGSGVVASCSYEARRWGVRTGMRLGDARRLCRSLRVLPGDYRRYEQAARRMLAICLEQTPRVEVAALDDLYLDLTHETSSPQEVAELLAAQMWEEIGLSVAVGLGASKLVANVATRQAKGAYRGWTEAGRLLPVVCVPAGQEQDFLAPWPVEVLPGVGPRVLERLQQLNVRRVGELAAMPPAVLNGLFGSRGLGLRQLAWGIDLRPVEPSRVQQAVSRSTSLEPPTSDRAFLQALLGHLLERAALWMRTQELAARGLTVALRYGDHQTVTGRASFGQPCAEEGPLREAARERLERLYARRLPLRWLGVELAPLTAPDWQGELFPDPERERAQRLTACKDAVRRRFGFMSLCSGTALLLGQQLEHDRDNFHLRTPCLTR
jgi:DNA polymerase-4